MSKETFHPIDNSSMEEVLVRSAALPATTSNTQDDILPSATHQSKQPVSQNFSNYLPVSYRDRSQELRIPVQSTREFLKQEFSVRRLNAVFNWLWLAGRPMPPRALHYQAFLRRKIVIVEKMDMHLLWARDDIFIKPIPRYLLDPNFWALNLRCRESCGCQYPRSGGTANDVRFCEEQKLRRVATGFLYSYCGLIVYESDFQLAKDALFIPKDITWQSMQTLLRGILEIPLLYEQIDRRFIFGELRLGRLNKIYRLLLISPLRGYQVQNTSYGGLWRDNLNLVASFAVYIALILTAMQVGLATPLLSQNTSFQSVSYGFTVFAILGPVGVFSVMLFVFIAIFIANWRVARIFYKERLRRQSQVNNS